MQNAVPRGFFCFSVFGLSPKVRIFIADFYQNWSLLEGIYDFDLFLKGYHDFFLLKMTSPRGFFEKCSGRFSSGGVEIYSLETTMKDKSVPEKNTSA